MSIDHWDAWFTSMQTIMRTKYSSGSSVDFWVMGWVKSAAVLLRRRARFHSLSGRLSRANFILLLKNLHTLVIITWLSRIYPIFLYTNACECVTVDRPQTEESAVSRRVKCLSANSCVENEDTEKTCPGSLAAKRRPEHGWKLCPLGHAF